MEICYFGLLEKGEGWQNVALGLNWVEGGSEANFESKPVGTSPGGPEWFSDHLWGPIFKQGDRKILGKKMALVLGPNPLPMDSNRKSDPDGGHESSRSPF